MDTARFTPPRIVRDNEVAEALPAPEALNDAKLADVVVTGYGTQLRGRVAGVAITANAPGASYKIANREISAADEKPTGKISTIEIKNDAEYMTAINKASSAKEAYTIYLKLRKQYQSTPAFYFDVARWLFAKNEKELGLKVLSTLTDFDLENEELYKTVAGLLKQQGFYKKELWITKKILDWRPMDAQSYRDYALALEDNGEYQQALDNLYKTLTQSYTQENAARDFGIEEVIVMEINNLIALHKKDLNISRINNKIIADLPVDIRVVINWNKDNTDIDLWVTDPNNEDCGYSHKATELGGRISNDITGGFGPEQFMLKKAVKGKYQIKTNFFGERQAVLSGPTTIMAEVYLYYQSGKQERKVITFQSEKNNNGSNNDNKIQIAEFEF
jgi:tetratricopeptide (TPR) repeat protein